MNKSSDYYEENPEEYESDREENREFEVKLAEKQAKKRKRYVYTPEECDAINRSGL